MAPVVYGRRLIRTFGHAVLRLKGTQTPRRLMFPVEHLLGAGAGWKVGAILDACEHAYVFVEYFPGGVIVGDGWNC
jgi:hypothetical protein